MKEATNQIPEIIQVIPTVDGISIDFKSIIGETFEKTIPHDLFREWTFSKGYWESAYYDFLDNVSIRVIKEFLINHKEYYEIRNIKDVTF